MEEKRLLEEKREEEVCPKALPPNAIAGQSGGDGRDRGGRGR